MMDHWLTYLNTFLQTHPRSGELFAFLVAFSESLPLIGTIVPGSITMTIIGILVGRNILPFSLTLIAATMGALAGDIIGCWVGKHYNEGLRRIWPFRNNPKWLLLGEAFFHKHGGKSIVIGRFVGPVRSTVPLIAGLLRISWSRFFSAAIPSAILWAIAYMLPGILVGAVSLELPPSKTTEFMLAGLAAVVALWFLFWLIQRFCFLLGDWLAEWVSTLWQTLKRSPRSNWLTRGIMNQNNPDDPHQLTLTLIACLSGLCFIALWMMVVTHTLLYPINEPLFNFLQSLRVHAIDTFFINFTLLGKYYVVGSAALITALGLAWKKQWRSAFHLVALTLLSCGAVFFFKHTLYSPRPDGFMTEHTSSSFPSGHTLFSLTIIGFIAFLSAEYLTRKWRWLPYLLGVIFITLIAFSRAYLGAHWLTDVLASTTLGITLLLMVIVSYRRKNPTQTIEKTIWIPLFLAAFFFPWAIYASLHFKTIEYQFTPYWPEKYTSLKNWWNNPKDFLPTYRMNRFGNPTQPFNVQWAAPLRAIQQQLLNEGWVLYKEKTNMKSTIQRFSSQKPEQHFPIFPWLYRHQAPVLLMIKHLPHQATIIELRLWQTGIQFKKQDFPLWIGTINYHASRQKWITFKKPHEITLTGDGGLSQLVGSLGSFEWKKIDIPSNEQPAHVQELNWDGSLLAIRVPTMMPHQKERENKKP